MGWLQDTAEADRQGRKALGGSRGWEGHGVLGGYLVSCHPPLLGSGCDIWSLESGGDPKDGNFLLMMTGKEGASYTDDSHAPASTLHQEFETSFKNLKKKPCVFIAHVPVEVRRGS